MERRAAVDDGVVVGKGCGDGGAGVKVDECGVAGSGGR